MNLRRSNDKLNKIYQGETGMYIFEMNLYEKILVFEGDGQTIYEIITESGCVPLHTALEKNSISRVGVTFIYEELMKCKYLDHKIKKKIISRAISKLVVCMSCEDYV